MSTKVVINLATGLEGVSATSVREATLSVSRRQLVAGVSAR